MDSPAETDDGSRVLERDEFHPTSHTGRKKGGGSTRTTKPVNMRDECMLYNGIRRQLDNQTNIAPWHCNIMKFVLQETNRRTT